MAAPTTVNNIKYEWVALPTPPNTLNSSSLSQVAPKGVDSSLTPRLPPGCLTMQSSYRIITILKPPPPKDPPPLSAIRAAAATRQKQMQRSKSCENANVLTGKNSQIPASPVVFAYSAQQFNKNIQRNDTPCDTISLPTPSLNKTRLTQVGNMDSVHSPPTLPRVYLGRPSNKLRAENSADSVMLARSSTARKQPKTRQRSLSDPSPLPILGNMIHRSSDVGSKSDKLKLPTNSSDQLSPNSLILFNNGKCNERKKSKDTLGSSPPYQSPGSSNLPSTSDCRSPTIACAKIEPIRIMRLHPTLSTYIVLPPSPESLPTTPKKNGSTSGNDGCSKKDDEYVTNESKNKRCADSSNKVVPGHSATARGVDNTPAVPNKVAILQNGGSDPSCPPRTSSLTGKEEGGKWNSTCHVREDSLQNKKSKITVSNPKVTTSSEDTPLSRDIHGLGSKKAESPKSKATGRKKFTHAITAGVRRLAQSTSSRNIFSGSRSHKPNHIKIHKKSTSEQSTDTACESWDNDSASPLTSPVTLPTIAEQLYLLNTRKARSDSIQTTNLSKENLSPTATHPVPVSDKVVQQKVDGSNPICD